MADRKTITIRNANIIKPMRNFKGEEKRYNGKIVNGFGKRNFCVELDNDFAHELLDEFPALRINGVDGERNPYLQVDVNCEPGRYCSIVYAGNSPERMHKLSVEGIEELDWLDWETIDMEINLSPYVSRQTGEDRVGVYLKKMFFVYEQDTLSGSYNIVDADEPEEIPFDED